MDKNIFLGFALVVFICHSAEYFFLCFHRHKIDVNPSILFFY